MEKLAKRQIKAKVHELQLAKPAFKGVASWIKYIRKALNMTPAQLAGRMQIAKSSLHQIERQEAEGKISVQSLKKAAEAMGCELVYALVPKLPIEEIMQKQAEIKAVQIIKASNLHMEYEDQSVDAYELEKQFYEVCENLKNSKQLWEQD